MVSLSDLTNGPKMFKETFGPKWGLRLWRTTFAIVAFAIVTVAISQAFGGWHSIYSEVRAWFSPPSTSAAPSPPVPPQGCNITGGENHGSIVQNCK